MTFTKPVILCLHGGGTNSTIFNVQLARLKRLLIPYYDFIFVDGPIIAGPGPDVLPIFADCEPYLHWVTPRSRTGDVPAAAVCADEEKRIDEKVAAALRQHLPPKGVIVGVMGFSAGAALATEFLLRKQRGTCAPAGAEGLDAAWRDLQFGILLNGVPPPWRGRGVGERVRLPTVHVHGLEDPWLEDSRVLLSDCFEFDMARLLEFNGGHHLPREEHENEKLKTLILEAAIREAAEAT